MDFERVGICPNGIPRPQIDLAAKDFGCVVLQSIDNAAVCFEIDIAILREDTLDAQVARGTARHGGDGSIWLAAIYNTNTAFIDINVVQSTGRNVARIRQIGVQGIVACTNTAIRGFEDDLAGRGNIGQTIISLIQNALDALDANVAGRVDVFDL